MWSHENHVCINDCCYMIFAWSPFVSTKSIGYMIIAWSHFVSTTTATWFSLDDILYKRVFRCFDRDRRKLSRKLLHGCTAGVLSCVAIRFCFASEGKCQTAYVSMWRVGSRVWSVRVCVHICLLDYNEKVAQNANYSRVVTVQMLNASHNCLNFCLRCIENAEKLTVSTESNEDNTLNIWVWPPCSAHFFCETQWKLFKNILCTKIYLPEFSELRFISVFTPSRARTRHSSTTETLRKTKGYLENTKLRKKRGENKEVTRKHSIEKNKWVTRTNFPEA